MSEQSLPARILSILKGASAWESRGYLNLSPSWLPMKTGRKQAPPQGGLYALGLPSGLEYDKGPSRIVYLGSSQKLAKRLAQHARCPRNEVMGWVQDTVSEDLSAAWWAIPDLPRNWLRALEGEALWAFDQNLGTVPIGNLDIPESPFSDQCKGLVKIARCADLENPLSLDALAEKLNRVCIREKFLPIGDPQELVITFSFVEQRDGETAFRVNRYYNAARFHLPQDGEPPPAQQSEDAIHAFIHDTNVAAWSVHKMREILGLCRLLRRVKKTRATKVKRFEAPTPVAPRPHSWGEVALIQGRIVSGSWFPRERTWVKIVAGKTLLAQAVLTETHFYGEDKSDLPQLSCERPRRWPADHEWDSPEMKAIIRKTNRELSKINRNVDLIMDVDGNEEPDTEQLASVKKERRRVLETAEEAIKAQSEHDKKNKRIEVEALLEGLFTTATRTL